MKESISVSLQGAALIPTQVFSVTVVNYTSAQAGLPCWELREIKRHVPTLTIKT